MSETAETAERSKEAVIETIKSKAEHPAESEGRELRWPDRCAVTILIMALLTAFAGMLAGLSANEALLGRTREILEVSEVQGQRLYVEVLRSKHEILTSLGQQPDPAEAEIVSAFEARTHELEIEAVKNEMLVATAVSAHQFFAVAVMLLSLGITLGGMSVIIGRRYLWVIGILLGMAGAISLALGVVTMLRQKHPSSSSGQGL
jgi:hypothetical protein